MFAIPMSHGMCGHGRFNVEPAALHKSLLERSRGDLLAIVHPDATLGVRPHDLVMTFEDLLKQGWMVDSDRWMICASVPAMTA